VGRSTAANTVKHRPFSTVPPIARQNDAGNPDGDSSLQLRVLVLGDACAGAENQSKGLVEHMVNLAEARNMKIQCTFRRVLPTRTFRMLPASLHIALAGLLWPFTKTLGLRVLDTDQNGVQMNITPVNSSGAQQDEPGQHGSTQACQKHNNKDRMEAHDDMFLSPRERDIFLGMADGFPDVVIACGRTTAPANVAIRRASNQRTYNIQVQDPRCRYNDFDAVITPAHDDISVVSILRSLGVGWDRDSHTSVHTSVSATNKSGTSQRHNQHSPATQEAHEHVEQTHAHEPRSPNANTRASHTDHALEHSQTSLHACTESIRTRLWQWHGNRILTVGSLHGVTKTTLASARAHAAHVIKKEITEADLMFGVLVGGPTRHCAWSADDLMHEIDTFISAWATRTRVKESESAKTIPGHVMHTHCISVGVVILLSRRTPNHVISRLSECAAHAEKKNGHNTWVQIFGHTDFPGGINPYKAVLDLSSCIIVTADSVSMCTEAVAAERHVCVACVHKATGKLALMHRLMALVCGTRARAGFTELSLHDLESVRDPKDTEKVACMLMERIEHRMR
jgi:mitochondrial fission protein ELM1